MSFKCVKIFILIVLLSIVSFEEVRETIAAGSDHLQVFLLVTSICVTR